MAAPQSRIELIEYAYRALGAPVLEINVDDDQANDRLDEAFQYWQEYHTDATFRMYYKHEVTAQDVTNGYITVPEALITVQEIFPFTDQNSSVNMFDVRYQMMLNDMYQLGHMGNLSNYVQIQQYLGTIDMILNGREHMRFNRHMNQLHIDTEWGVDIQEGEYVIIHGWQLVDPSTYPDVYNDMWLKRYVTALIKRQWGMNLIKFEGMQLPGGVMLNGRQLYDDAQNDIQQLEEEIRMNFEMPFDMFVG